MCLVINNFLVCSRRTAAPACTRRNRGRGSVFKAHSAGHPLKRGVTYGVRGHTQNQTNGTRGRGVGVRKTYKNKILMLFLQNESNCFFLCPLKD